jgi:AcrR family transcriptional regulator
VAVAEKKVVQGRETRAALISAARDIFGIQGFAATNTEEIAAKAGVTKGAIYHHFGGKDDLFCAVFEQVQVEISNRVSSVFVQLDPWEALVGGCELWVDAHQDPAVRQIVLRDARSVLGADVVRDLDMRFGAVGLRGCLRKGMTHRVLERQPLRPLAMMLAGALKEACLYVADAENVDEARAEVSTLITHLLQGLRVPAEAN